MTAVWELTTHSILYATSGNAVKLEVETVEKSQFIFRDSWKGFVQTRGLMPQEESTRAYGSAWVDPLLSSEKNLASDSIR